MFWTLLIVSSIALVLISLVLFGWKYLAGWVRGLFGSGAGLGEKCGLDTDCAGWGPDADQTACCNGVCTRKQADWSGVGWCPNECKGWPAAPGGTCDQNEKCPPGYTKFNNGLECCQGEVRDGKCMSDVCALTKNATPGVKYCSAISGLYHWPRWEGETCKLHEDCAGYGPDINSTACCGGVCTRKQADWAGVGWCPSECKGWPAAPNGTCGQDSRCPAGYTKLGDRCCMMKSGECSNTCSLVRGDSVPLCSTISGLYHWPRWLGEPCGVSADCENTTGTCAVGCCNGKCAMMSIDWTGSAYCPSQCSCKFGQPGTCPSCKAANIRGRTQ